MQVAAEGLVAVQFQICHDKIGISHAEIRAGGTPFALVVAGPFGIIDGGDLSTADGHTGIFHNCEEGAHRRLHLIALLGDLFLQILSIINAHRCKTGLFVQTEQDGSAFVLIGKTGERVIEFVRTALMRGFDLDGLKFSLMSADQVGQLDQFGCCHCKSLPFIEILT